MLTVQSPPLSGHHHLIQRPKSGRKPLQPKNSPAASSKPNYKPASRPAESIDKFDYSSNKENVPPLPPSITPLKKLQPLPLDSFDASLAEELTAIRQKLERLRYDKESTDKMLKERSLMLDLQIKEILGRGEVQKQLEIEVDRLYRLKEIRLSCMRISAVRSLRDKEQEKKMKQDQLKANSKIEDTTAETRDEFKSPLLQSPNPTENIEGN